MRRQQNEKSGSYENPGGAAAKMISETDYFSWNPKFFANPLFQY